MSQRINISVPDDLYEKMQAFKDRLNISKLCQNAILKAVKLEELRSQTKEEIDKLAVSFNKEREEYGQKFKEEGFKDGTRDGFSCDFQWMYTIWTHRDAETPEKLCEMGSTEKTREKVETEHLETDLDFFICFDHVKDLYFKGWLEGFLDVWDRVAKKMSIDDQV
jgi:post-segregation antitoxin (ccd killing protein)